MKYDYELLLLAKFNPWVIYFHSSRVWLTITENIIDNQAYILISHIKWNRRLKGANFSLWPSGSIRKKCVNIRRNKCTNLEHLLI
jgi:hypothetical protein